MILRLISLSAAFSASLVAQASLLFTVQETGARSERVNIVILGDGYTSTDMPSFGTHVNKTIEFLFSREPWAQYRNY